MQISGNIYRHGIYLTGGASQISHLADMLGKSTGLRVNVAERPIESVVLGLSKVLNEENYKSVAYAIEGMGK